MANIYDPPEYNIRGDAANGTTGSQTSGSLMNASVQQPGSASGNNAFADWDAYNRIIGLGWRRADEGDALTITEGGQVLRIPSGEGRGTGHGPRVDAVITRLGDHPMHQGLPREWKTPDIEVYHYARGPAENVEVLSYTHDVQTDMRWPVEWTVGSWLVSV